MKRAVSLAVLLLAVGTQTAAQSFGELFPLTNTRYRTAYAIPKLVATDHDFVLFWSGDRKFRATPLRENQARAGHVVLDTALAADAVWLGNRFMVVSSRFNDGENRARLIARMLDAEAQPVGRELALPGRGIDPKIAAGPSSILILFQSEQNQLEAMVIGRDGALLAAPHPIAFGHSYAVAATAEGFVAAISDYTRVEIFAFDANGQTIAQRTLSGPSTIFRDVAIASNGAKTLVTWPESGGMRATLIEPNGNLGNGLILDSGNTFRTPSATWNEAGWSVSYEEQIEHNRQTKVAHLDFAAQQVLSREHGASGYINASIASLDGRVLAAWRPQYSYSAAQIVALPFAQNTARAASFAATEQTLLASTTSATGTLVVWSERSETQLSIRTGLRTHDGHWSERELVMITGMTGPGSAVAASDGQRFVVAVTGREGRSMLYPIGEEGRPTAPARSLTMRAVLMAWNGSRYALISQGGFQGGFEAMLVNANAEPSSPITSIPDITFQPSAIASNGNGFLVGGPAMECQFLLCFPAGVRAIRLDANLQRVDAEDLVLIGESGSGNLMGAAWNGSEYLVAAQDDHSDRLFRVPASPASPIDVTTFDGGIYGQSMTITKDGRIAIAGVTQDAGPRSTRVIFLNAAGHLQSTIDLERVSGTNLMRLESMPDGGIAYLSSSVQDIAPHHGTSHIMFAMARPSIPLPPAPPRVAARMEGSRIEIDWSASAGMINGYRVEYRVDDGTWNELEDWFLASENHTSMSQPVGSRFAIRMRAFNDGGTSEYSPVAVANPMRRRAVR